MEHVQGPSSVGGLARVHERGARGGDREAARRALRQQAGEQAAAQPGTGGEAPVRPGLQRRASDGRKETGTALHHVDVIA